MILIGHRFAIGHRRLHPFLPLGMAFTQGTDGAWMHRDAPLLDEIGDITAEQIAHAVNALGPALREHATVYGTEHRPVTLTAKHHGLSGRGAGQPPPRGQSAFAISDDTDSQGMT